MLISHALDLEIVESKTDQNRGLHRSRFFFSKWVHWAVTMKWFRSYNIIFYTHEGILKAKKIPNQDCKQFVVKDDRVVFFQSV